VTSGLRAIVAGPAAGWVADGERYFAERLAGVTDERFAEPSRLTGWTRAHLVAHAARNADALIRLVDWARTGVESPMYADPQARAREIEKGATLPAAQLRAEAADASARLAAAWAALPEKAWSARVRSALGRDIAVSETLWMRAREVWVHGVDLDAGGSFADLPADVVAALLDDATTTLTQRGAPDVLLHPTDHDGGWRLGAADITAGTTVALSAPAHRLLAWVLGREAAPGPDPAPSLPRWL
jgi:maleylpyruvate isomerase